MRIGVLSTAHVHTAAYLRILGEMAGVELIGLADEDIDRGARFAQAFNTQQFDSYAALLAEKPDGVVVCSENSKHRPLVEMAAGVGAHVLCEKPLATTLEDGRAMIDACARAGVKLMTAFPVRFSPAVSEVKARLDRGDLGKVLAISGTNQGQLPMRHAAWFVDPELAGGGAVMDHTVHLADIYHWYLDSAVTEVYAQTNRIFHADAVQVETGGLVMLKFANGTFASIDCSWSKPDNYPTWGGLTFELVTENGAVFVDAFRQHLALYSGEQRPAWVSWGSDADGAMIAEFVAAIREDRAPLISGEDGYYALEVALAAYQSAASNRPVKIG